MERFNSISHLKKIVEECKLKKILLVCGHSYEYLVLNKEVSKLPIEIIYFQDFHPNPRYEDVLKGIKVFKDNNCDSILAVGGGSCIDVAKCIKLFNKLDDTKLYFEQDYKSNNIPFIVIPTTAGSGSEETPFAVIYYQGNKMSIQHDSIKPQYIFLLPEVLETLPLYLKKATLLDAFSQAIESYWSVNSTEESQEYSKKSINLIMDNYKEYLMNYHESYERIMQASNYAGRAIAITKTTAPHAMSYKLTSLYGIAHGQAVYLTLPYVLEYMNNNLDKVIDKRGRNHVLKTFKELATILKCDNIVEMIKFLKKLYIEFDFERIIFHEKDFPILTESVNVERLKNNPVSLDEVAIEQIYWRSLQ